MANDRQALSTGSNGLGVCSQGNLQHIGGGGIGPILKRRQGGRAQHGDVKGLGFRRMKGGTMNFGTMAYTWVSPAGDTYLYQVESSLDLFLWGVQPGALIEQDVTDTTDDPDNVETATYRTVSPLGAPSTQYLRLSITINPE